MSETHTDLVIQLSTSGQESDASGENNEESKLIPELRRWLQPGVEIALSFHGFKAITSILWLSECQAAGSFRAGVRLLGVSAQPDIEQTVPESQPDEAQRGVIRALPGPQITCLHF
jgi:hypothetical protein